MNIIDLLCDKLRLVVRYCAEERIGMAVIGMADLNEVLPKAIETIITFNKENIELEADIEALTGSFRSALDAASRKDGKMLTVSLGEGIIPEIERARHNGIEVPFPTEAVERLKTEQRLGASQMPAVICLFGYGNGSYYEKLCNIAPEGSTFIV